MSELLTIDPNSPEQFQNPYPNRRPNEAALFVENKVILQQSDELVYDVQLNQFVSREASQRQNIISAELWQNADTEKNKLYELVARVQGKLNKEKGSNENTNLRTCKWDEVMSVVSTTAQRWKSSTSHSAKAWRCIEKFGQASATLEVWMSLLPAGDYGSSICGAFKLAIGAASQHSRVMECVFEALGDIPEAMESAQKYVLIYKNTHDHFLERKTFDLYLAVLRALIEIMQFIADNGSKKVINLAVRQKEYKASLFKSVEEVKKRTARIKDEAAQCLAARNEKMHRMIDETNGKVDEAARVLQMIYIMLNEEMASLHKKYAQLALQNQQREENPTSRPQKTISAPKKSSKFALKTLLATLSASPTLPPTDLQRTLSSLHSLSSTAQTRAASLVQHPLLRSWLASTTSRCLLVNGHQDLSSTSTSTSPLSVIAATLLKITPESAVRLSYFCALHPCGLDPAPESAPRGILASLVQQLITQILSLHLVVKIDESFLSASSLKKIGEWNLSKLSSIFRFLIQQLPPRTIVILTLDEVSLYETRALGKETDAFMRRITSLVWQCNNEEREEDEEEEEERNREGGVIFKLLVTCRGRALDFGQYFSRSEGEVLDLQEEVEVDYTAGWKLSSFAGEG